ncbi:DNA-primase RepB domain-containing protein [Methylocystis parvus]|uniref:DNA-primase RepB domain-containing protein n=1 Tax=Methylocystis parvus TaxID=134 RepID=UPI003C763691
MNEMIIADPLKSLDFLECMFGPEGTLHLIAISEGEPPEAKSFVPEQRRALLLWVQQREGRSNIYFAANRLADGFMNRKAKKENVAAALMLHVDVDDPDALERVSAFTPKPTAVVFSGGGYQAFWLLKEPMQDLGRVEAINKAIAGSLGGDNCHNIDRIMRLPGTINVPDAKKRAKGRVEALAYLVSEETDWSRRYELSDFAALLTVVAVTARDLAPVDLTDLPEKVSEETRALIKQGDDKDRPIGSSKPRFKSRSEALWRVARDLAQANCSWPRSQAF